MGRLAGVGIVLSLANNDSQLKVENLVYVGVLSHVFKCLKMSWQLGPIEPKSYPKHPNDRLETTNNTVAATQDTLATYTISTRTPDQLKEHPSNYTQHHKTP